jgi:transposase
VDRLELVFLPPYSPQLNPIEGLWKWIKQSAIANVFFSSASEIRAAVLSFIEKVSQDPLRIVDRLCSYM